MTDLLLSIACVAICVVVALAALQPAERKSGQRPPPRRSPPAPVPLAGADFDLPVKWTGADGTQHECTDDHAVEVLKWLYDEFPGGLDEAQAVISGTLPKYASCPTRPS